MEVPTVVNTPYERRFIGGHFSFSRIGDGDFNRIDPLIKGYFLTPSLETDDNRGGAIQSLYDNVTKAIADIDDFNGLVTSVVSPVSGYQTALLWKKSCSIMNTPLMWHKEDDELKQIPFEPCSRELNIFGLEMPHYMKLLRSKGSKEDVIEYGNSWVENQELF